FLGERPIKLVYPPGNNLLDPWVSGEFLVAGIGDVIAFGPVAHRNRIDVDDHGDEVALLAERHRFAHLGEELDAVLKILWSYERAAIETTDVLGAVDDFEMSALVEKAGITGVHPTVGCLGLIGGSLVFIILEEHARALEHHLTAVGDLDLDVGCRPANRVGIDFPIRLHSDVDAGFGLSIKLL